MPETERLVGVAESEGLVATPNVGHDPHDLDAEACIENDCGLEEGDSADGLPVGFDLGEGAARVIVD